MKRFIQSILAFVTVLFLTAALAGSALAAPDVPLKGSVDAVETLTIDFPRCLSIRQEVGGYAPRSLHSAWEFTVNPEWRGGWVRTRCANGDSFSTTSLGQGTPQETPNINIVVERTRWAGQGFQRQFSPDASGGYQHWSHIRFVRRAYCVALG